jgi:putative protein-disulfide isomerase
MAATLYYAHDPMCSWCWGFRPAWQALREQLPPQIKVHRLLGGLAPDNDQPMEEAMRRQLQGTWRRIQARIPDTRFNFDFWELCRPRRATYPACRAVIAAREFGAQWEEPMIVAIQQAYYLQARNPSNPSTLIELAQEIGLDGPAFHQTLTAESTNRQLAQEIAVCREYGLTSFPSLALDVAGSRWPIAVDYTNPGAIKEQIVMLLD